MIGGGPVNLVKIGNATFLFSSTIGIGTGSITVNGGLLTLSGANVYTGATTVNGGTLIVTSLADGGTNSSIGASSTAASQTQGRADTS